MRHKIRSLPRRDFLYGASAAALVTLIHGPQASAATSGTAAATPVASAPPDPLILDLRLQTVTPLAELRTFYRERIGFPVLAEKPGEITFGAGLTPLTFVLGPGDSGGSGNSAAGRPFYHFAFNIPEDKIRAAREWQSKRSALITTPEHLRDAGYPDDVRHFAGWNAHSVFFWDPAGNLVEYIARHELHNGAAGEFGTADILHASEIGFVVEEAERPALSRALMKQLGLPGYEPTRLDADSFWALGDEQGLALLLPRGPRLNVDRARQVEFGVFPVEARLRGGKRETTHAIAGYPYRITGW
jgi:hypothetical protein